MRIRTAITKSIKWGGGTAFLLLAFVWALSKWGHVDWYPPANWSVRIVPGRIAVFDSGIPYDSPIGPARWTDAHGGLYPVNEPMSWTFEYSPFVGSRGGTRYFVPLWFPCILVLIPTALAWRADRIAHRRAMPGACPKCGYARAGLGPGAVCPECGTAAVAAGAE